MKDSPLRKRLGFYPLSPVFRDVWLPSNHLLRSCSWMVFGDFPRDIALLEFLTLGRRETDRLQFRSRNVGHYRQMAEAGPLKIPDFGQGA